MSNGKGNGPRKGYNWAKYAENYDAIFRPNQRKEPMKTPEQEQPNPQPILPWHREAAKEIGSLYWAAQQDDDFPQDSEVAAIIHANDPHAAQHATTLRLLEEAKECVPWGEMAKNSLHARICAHLAAMKGSK